MKDFVLDRSRWHRGKGGGNSMLLRKEDGKMCCLGLYLESCGVPRSELLERRYPPSEAHRLPEGAKWLDEGALTPRPYKLGEALYPAVTFMAVTNDSEDIDDAERERRLANGFADHGIQVRFVDSAPLPNGEPKEDT